MNEKINYTNINVTGRKKKTKKKNKTNIISYNHVLSQKERREATQKKEKEKIVSSIKFRKILALIYNPCFMRLKSMQQQIRPKIYI